MYNRQIVNMVEMERISEWVEIPQAYEVRTDRPHVWSQRICCYILDKLRATSHRNQISYCVHRVDVTDLFDKITYQYNQAWEYTDKPPRTVLIGSEDFHELLGAPLFRNAMEFSINVAQGPYHRGNLFGVAVKVIPWMSGILVLP